MPSIKASRTAKSDLQPAHPLPVGEALTALDRYRRNALLETVAVAARDLLRTSDLKISLPNVAERIGLAAGVDRVHIFLIEANDGRGGILKHWMWTVENLPTPDDFRNPTQPMTEVGLASWLDRLKDGGMIAEHTRAMAPAARSLFERGGVQSTLAVPIFADETWQGFIGFDVCRGEREWSTAELDAIRTLAELIGAAIARTIHLESLADATRIIESSPTVLFRLAPQPPFPLIYVSENLRQYGYEAKALLAEPARWLSLIEPTDRSNILTDLNGLIEGKSERVRLDFRLRKPDGSQVWFESDGRLLHSATGKLIGIEGILNDVTERKQTAEKIATLARTDWLTGLANRAAFVDRLNLEWARAKRSMTQFALHYIDLDRFKDINDTLGHPMGDKLLQTVAERLRQCVRETDMIARFGGDEFAVLQDNVSDPVEVEALAIKIGRVIASPYRLGGNDVTTSASIGVVLWHAGIESADAMMMKADLALYRAKAEGRNQFRFHVAELDDQTRERMLISEDLRHAVERGEFELYYQPQVELATGRPIGLEGLLRWNHPRRGVLSPSMFVPIAETTGSIGGIGAWVIGQVCQQIKQWKEGGTVPPLIAVNISGSQFKLAGDIDRIVTAELERYGVAPRQLELELTESVLIETARRAGDMLKRLLQSGIRIAIDDFGTGYSSLDYLRSFRVSRLKIDRRFVEHVAVSPDDAAIVRATIGLAHALGIEVLAEGVETETQRDFLISAGCRLGQGFYFAPPMTATAAAEYLRSQRQSSAA